ncbi:hypothetical protein FB382_002926 [Nocardioides ginsengisegetis]|uniref:Capsular polysaccharide biosynthesis protein n=1 Tax=Nocardioides ginsengisegetis TaxID=661491 RepID=A0A7W3J1T7_9ACTN|nr:hypothetical protein [Nocardioides ginsengisegetis]MBA8804635.1 hypothetical protein [Nocardioides ginsengisegetis]
MYLHDFSSCLRRHWILTILAFLVAGGLGALASSHLKPSYTTQANIVLLPPDSSVVKGGNPYLYLGNLGQAADVLIRVSNSDDTRAAVKAQAPLGDYEVSHDWTTSAPMLVVTIKAPTAAAAVDLTRAVQAEIPANLAQLQDDLAVPDKSRIDAFVVSKDAVPKPDQKVRFQLIAVVLVGSLFLQSLLIAAWDSLVRRYRRRKADRLERAEQAEEPEPGPHDDLSGTRVGPLEIPDGIDEPDDADEPDPRRRIQVGSGA